MSFLFIPSKWIGHSPTSHRNPLALLSKIKRQLSKSPTAKPIEHQYLPIPTQSTYSSSNSSSVSSFILMDHNEEPEYKTFLPLIIQHERRLAAAQPPQKRTPEPPPTSTAFSKSPITPIFNSSFFEDSDDDDDDGIMSFSGSEMSANTLYLDL
jgi:hypothetical protein